MFYIIFRTFTTHPIFGPRKNNFSHIDTILFYVGEDYGPSHLGYNIATLLVLVLGLGVDLWLRVVKAMLGG